MVAYQEENFYFPCLLFLIKCGVQGNYLREKGTTMEIDDA